MDANQLNDLAARPNETVLGRTAEASAVYNDGSISRAHVTGKVPDVFKRGKTRRRKGVKLGTEQKRHVGKLQQRGLISAKAAASQGLSGAKR